MSLLFRLVYATHANGTHHKLALDGVRLLACKDAEQWQRLFLKHAELLMQGSKVPDNEFKDFKNHVLHPGDKYWGGAPEKVRSWYAHLVEALQAQDWPRAAWCAGVLSHYYTDPIHPFHTGQSEAENNIHRAVEWSINRAYDGLLAEGQAAHPTLDVELPSGPDWIADLVCQGADTSHRYYEKLIAHYDITRGVSDPPSGLDPIARRLIGELLVYASTGFARLLARAITESGVAAPEVSLSVESVLATLQVPLKWVAKKLADAADRRVVEAMYDELKATGRVEQTLPEDDRMVRELHAEEVAAPRAAARAAERAERISTGKVPLKRPPVRAVPPRAPAAAPQPAQPAQPAAAAPQPARPAQPAAAAPQPARPQQPAAAAPQPARPQQPAAVASPRAPSLRDALAALSPDSPRPAPVELPSAPAERPARPCLAAGDDIEAAPSIGPKTAERLIAVGLIKVADLLAADPERTATAIGVRHVTAQTIRDWQDQARLVMEVAGLRGTHAQLLVGAEFRNAAAVAEADPVALSAAILAFATTREGERVLRSGDTPDIARIRQWIASAATARAA